MRRSVCAVLICQSANAGFELYDDEQTNHQRTRSVADASDFIVDIREYDVPYHVRVAIDKGPLATGTRIGDED